MLKHMDASRTRRCLVEAASSPLSNPVVRYPRWYLQRWHFLPEGYLSPRSASAYEGLVRRVYNAGLERVVLAKLVAAIEAQAPASITELGCGPGRALAVVSRCLPKASLTGIDLSPFMLERAERRLATPRSHIALVHGSGTEVPFPDASSDAVVAIHFIGHLPRAVANRAWREASRLLVPGGRLYVIDHAWHPLHGSGLTLRSRGSLLKGLLSFSIFEKPILYGSISAVHPGAQSSAFRSTCS